MDCAKRERNREAPGKILRRPTALTPAGHILSIPGSGAPLPPGSRGGEISDSVSALFVPEARNQKRVLGRLLPLRMGNDLADGRILLFSRLKKNRPRVTFFRETLEEGTRSPCP